MMDYRAHAGRGHTLAHHAHFPPSSLLACPHAAGAARPKAVSLLSFTVLRSSVHPRLEARPAALNHAAAPRAADASAPVPLQAAAGFTPLRRGLCPSPAASEPRSLVVAQAARTDAASPQKPDDNSGKSELETVKDEVLGVKGKIAQLELLPVGDPERQRLAGLEQQLAGLQQRLAALQEKENLLLKAEQGPARVMPALNIGKPQDGTVAYLKQILPLFVVPPLEDLEEVLFQGLIDKYPHARPLLPVEDDDYTDFLDRYPTYNDLPTWIGPMSKIAPARELRRIVTAAVNYDIGAPESELGMAGDVNLVIWHPLHLVSTLFKQQWSRGRNVAETSLTVPELRPDFALLAPFGTLQQRRMMFKGEEKQHADDLNKAMWELGAKMRGWSALYFGKAPYLLCYASAGTDLQFAVLPAAPREQADAVALGPKLDLSDPIGRLKALHVTLRVASVLIAWNQLLPPNTAPIGHVQRHGDATTIIYNTRSVIKEVDTQLLPTFDVSIAGIQRLQAVYAATRGCPHIIQAVSRVHFNPIEHKYRISLAPVGHNIISSAPPIRAQLREAVRCILLGLLWLHATGHGHGDLRWPNVCWRFQKADELVLRMLGNKLDQAAAAAPKQAQAAAAATAAAQVPPAVPPSIPAELHSAVLQAGAFFTIDMESAILLGSAPPQQHSEQFKAWGGGAALEGGTFTAKSDLYMLGNMLEQARKVWCERGVSRTDTKQYEQLEQLSRMLLSKQLTVVEALQHPFVSPPSKRCSSSMESGTSASSSTAAAPAEEEELEEVAEADQSSTQANAAPSPTPQGAEQQDATLQSGAPQPSSRRSPSPAISAAVPAKQVQPMGGYIAEHEAELPDMSQPVTIPGSCKLSKQALERETEEEKLSRRLRLDTLKQRPLIYL